MKLEIITKEKIEKLICTEQMKVFPTQPKLCAPMVNRIYKKMMIGVPFSAIKVVEGMIGDGHHRYIASLLANISLEHTPTNKTTAMKKIDWITVIIEADDWESIEDIDKHNRKDAETLQIETHQLLAMMER